MVLLQEKSELEHRLSTELESQRERCVNQKIKCAAEYEQVKKPLEDEFIRDRNMSEIRFVRETQQHQQVVDDVKQVFTNGENRLTGKLQDNFICLVCENRKSLDNEQIRLKEDLKTLREQTDTYKKEIVKLQVVISNQKEKHEVEIGEVKTRYLCTV